MMVSNSIQMQVRDRVEKSRDDIIQFMREIVAIPSMDSGLTGGERIGAEMRKLGSDEVRFDVMGNILGRIGSGPRVMVFDSHIDTVGIGDPAEWSFDPFQEKLRMASCMAGALATRRAAPQGWFMAWQLPGTLVCWKGGRYTILAIWKNGVMELPPIPLWKWTRRFVRIMW